MKTITKIKMKTRIRISLIIVMFLAAAGLVYAANRMFFANESFPTGITASPTQLLVSQYIGYGDALAGGGQPCGAVAQYESALSLRNDTSVSAKRDAAQTACTTQATQGVSGTPLPGGIAPVGVAPVGGAPTPG